MTEKKEYDGSNTMILAPGDLRLGMHVSYLDRPWSDSPFPFRGFRIESESELAQLRQTCDYVFVDARNSRNDYHSYFESRNRRFADEDAPEPAANERVLLPTEREFPLAKKIHADLRKAIIECYREAAAGGAPYLRRLKSAAHAVVESVQRSPDALLYFVRTQTDGDYLYRHSVACAVMLCVLGESMGKSFQELRTLTMGGALLDVGKTRIASDLLNKPRAIELSSAEVAQLRRHVERGAEIVSRITSEGGPLVTMIMSHHERFNGKGYPRSLKGSQIPAYGQMASIVDMFDAMISDRCYGRRATPYEAMRYIRAQRDEDFDADLVQAFRKAFRTYPTGTLVELSTGEVGFVLQQTESRLQPRVYIVLNAKKEREGEFRVINMSDDENKKLCVARCLQAGSFGIDY